MPRLAYSGGLHESANGVPKFPSQLILQCKNFHSTGRRGTLRNAAEMGLYLIILALPRPLRPQPDYFPFAWRWLRVRQSGLRCRLDVAPLHAGWRETDGV